MTELFPISSLGHSVLFPTLFRWHNIVSWQSQPESPWLAFVVMLHVGSAIGLLAYFWRDWIAIIRAFFATLGKRRIETSSERLAWLIIIATIPVGILGLALEHPVRDALAKPLAAAIFLIVNGVILLAGERYRRNAEVRELAHREGLNPEGARGWTLLEFQEAGHRHRAVGRADRRHQPRRRGHDRRTDARPEQFRRRQVRLLPGHPADPGRRPPGMIGDPPTRSAMAESAGLRFWRRCSRRSQR